MSRHEQLWNSCLNIIKDNINEASAYLQRFDIACRELEMQGYRIALSTESLALQAKGFI